MNTATGAAAAAGGRTFFPGAWFVLNSCVSHRGLLFALMKREIVARYRGSALGLMWSLITPIVLLATYTLVFSYFFQMKWSPEDSGRGYFIVMLFCGLIPFNFLTEVVARSPGLIIASPNYVKRVAFPVQLLPAVATGAALFHALIGMAILILMRWLVLGSLPWTVLYLPLIWLPLVIFTLAVSLIVSAAGVFIRDLGHAVGLILNVVFFLSAVIYPASTIPESWRLILWLNPLACAILQIRETCVQGMDLNLRLFGVLMGGSVLLLIAAAGWFRSVSRRFADVM